jgi:hypothetical protein
MKVITTLVVEQDGEPRINKRLGGDALVQSITPIGKSGRYALIMTSESLEGEERAIEKLKRLLPAARISKQTIQYFSG